MNIIWTEPAVEDLHELHAYIARDSEMYASGFVERIILAAFRLVDYPKVGRVVPETNDESVREILYQGYRLIYRVKGDSIEILSVIPWSQGSGRGQTRSMGGWLVRPDIKRMDKEKEKAHIGFLLNGETAEVAFAPHKTLLEVLREDLGLTGTKHGCELGECGTCAVLVNGRSILSCLMLGLDAEGQEVKTIEGMAEGAQLHPLQDTFADTGAAQCGYCSPGFLLVAEELLKKDPNPTREVIKEALSGNLCRCTGYIKIYEAVELAAARMRGEEMELPRESVYGYE